MTHRHVSWSRARAEAAACVGPVAPAVVPLAAAAGLVLAEPARALTDLPARDASAMDGWAVAGPGPWLVVGEVLAGGVPAVPLARAEAVRIATGGQLPQGADRVLRREHGRSDGLRLVAVDGVDLPPGTDIRSAAGECRADDVVLPEGALVSPAAVGMLAAAGLDRVAVRRVAADVLVLGDELLTSGPARDGRLRDALGPLLTAWLPAWGVAVASRRHVPDTAAGLRVALRACLADVVVTTGSTAAGPVDHLHPVLAELGARLVVDGVAVRPGHPQVLAVLPDGRPLVGLPGNPLAAVSGLFTLLEPVLRALTGRDDDDPAATPRTVRLAVDVGAGDEATRLIPVRHGRPTLHAGPAMLRGLIAADGLAVIPPRGAAAGDEVLLLTIP